MTYGAPGPQPPHGYGPPQQPPREPSPWTSPAVIIAIVAGVLILVGGALAAIVFIPKGSDEQAAPVTVTQVAPDPAQPRTDDDLDADSAPAAPQPGQIRPLPDDPDPRDPNEAPRDVPTVPGTDWQGFASGPRCNAADDPAVAIAETARSRIVICRVGAQGGLYYKGLADGNPIELQFPRREGGGYVATNGPTSYRVDAAALVITRSGETLAVEPTIHYWSK